MKLPPTPNQRIATALGRVTPAHAGGRTNLVAPTPALPSAGSTATTNKAARFATVVVAASNSSAAGKYVADYACTGTADETTLNSAIADVKADGGGVVQLLEGDFTLAGDVNNDDSTRVWLRGLGGNSRLVSGGLGYGVLMSGESARLSDLYIDGPVKVPWGQHCRVHDIYASGGLGDFGTDAHSFAGGVAVTPGAAHDYLSIYDCEIEGAISFVVRPGWVMTYTHLTGCRLGDVYLEFGDLADDGSYLVVANNTITGNLAVLYGHEVSIVGNIGWNTLDITNIDRIAIAGNIFPGGFTQSGCTNVAQSGNVFV